MTRAHNRVQYALAHGKMLKPSECSACGASGRIEGHHEDYDKPLDVVWLCRRCHKEQHAMESLDAYL